MVAFLHPVNRKKIKGIIEKGTTMELSIVQYGGDYIIVDGNHRLFAKSLKNICSIEFINEFLSIDLKDMEEFFYDNFDTFVKLTDWLFMERNWIGYAKTDRCFINGKSFNNLTLDIEDIYEKSKCPFIGNYGYSNVYIKEGSDTVLLSICDNDIKFGILKKNLNIIYEKYLNLDKNNEQWYEKAAKKQLSIDDIDEIVKLNYTIYLVRFEGVNYTNPEEGILIENRKVYYYVDDTPFYKEYIGEYNNKREFIREAIGKARYITIEY